MLHLLVEAIFLKQNRIFFNVDFCAKNYLTKENSVCAKYINNTIKWSARCKFYCNLNDSFIRIIIDKPNHLLSTQNTCYITSLLDKRKTLHVQISEYWKLKLKCTLLHFNLIYLYAIEYYWIPCYAKLWPCSDTNNCHASYYGVFDELQSNAYSAFLIRAGI